MLRWLLQMEVRAEKLDDPVKGIQHLRDSKTRYYLAEGHVTAYELTHTPAGSDVLVRK